MAYLISKQSGNFTDANTWALADATSAKEDWTYNYVTAITSSWTTGTTFTPGAITIDGIAVKIGWFQSTTGTFIVALDQGGSTVTGTSVSINCSSIPQVARLQDGFMGWVFFKFGANVTLQAATAYAVKMQTSGATGTNNVKRTSTANDFCRLLRIANTTQAPTPGDHLYVMGENTGPGTSSAFTVTMDNTVDYSNTMTFQSRTSNVLTVTTGTNHNFQVGWPVMLEGGYWVNGLLTVASIPAANQFTCASTGVDRGNIASTGKVGTGWNLNICQNGTFQYGTNAGTNYHFRAMPFGYTNSIAMYTGATLTIGTQGSPIPDTSTAILECYETGASSWGNGIEHDASTITMWGQDKTGRTLLTSDAAVGATTISVADATNWKTGDTIIIAGTELDGTWNHYEKRVIGLVTPDIVAPLDLIQAQGGQVGGGTSANITLTVGLTYAHIGTAPYQAEVINVTRNVKFQGFDTSSATAAWIRPWVNSVYKSAGNLTLRNTEFTNLGGNGSVSAQGIFVVPNTAYSVVGSVDIQGCSIHDAIGGFVYYIYLNQAGNPFTFSNNVGGITTMPFIQISGSTGTSTTWTIDSNCHIGGGTNSGTIQLYDVGGTLTNNWIANNGYNGTSWGALSIQESNTFGTWSGNVIHNSYSAAIYMGVWPPVGSTFSGSGYTVNRNWAGIYMPATISQNNTSVTTGTALTLDGWSMAGNYNHVYLQPSAILTTNLALSNCTFDGIVGMRANIGVSLYLSSSTYNEKIYFYNCSFGQTLAFGTGDIVLSNTGTMYKAVVECYGCLFDAKPFSGTAYMGTSGYMASERHNRQDGSYLYVTLYGTCVSDTVLYNTASPSLRMTPNNASNKIKGGSFLAAVPSGGTPTVSVWYRNSTSTDPSGANYNGNAPRLMLVMNQSLGMTADVVIATGNTNRGTWQQLSGSVAGYTGAGVLEFYVDCDGTTGWVNVDDFSLSGNGDSTSLNYSLKGQGAMILGNTQTATGNPYIAF